MESHWWVPPLLLFSKGVGIVAGCVWFLGFLYGFFSRRTSYSGDYSAWSG